MAIQTKPGLGVGLFESSPFLGFWNTTANDNDFAIITALINNNRTLSLLIGKHE